MTEQEAKTKWCPQYRATSEAVSWTHNREGACECIASECMWWIPEKQDTYGEIIHTHGGHCGAVK